MHRAQRALTRWYNHQLPVTGPDDGSGEVGVGGSDQRGLVWKGLGREEQGRYAMYD